MPHLFWRRRPIRGVGLPTSATKAQTAIGVQAVRRPLAQRRSVWKEGLPLCPRFVRPSSKPAPDQFGKTGTVFIKLIWQTTHRTDCNICGHVFCSFLALALRDELFRRMERARVQAEWANILPDLNALTETVIAHDGKRFVVRSATVGIAGRIAQCGGVRLP